MNQKLPANNVLITMFLILVLSIVTFSSNGQSSERITKTFETGDFNGLFLEGAFGVRLLQGRTASVMVETSDSRAFDYLNVTNKNGLLHLHVDRRPFDFSKVTLYVTFETLDYLRIFGGIKLDTRGYLDLDDLDILLEGGAKINLQVKARRLNIENKGGLLCELSGVAKSLDIHLAGAGHIAAGELKAADVNFLIEGVGTGMVHATKNLQATIKGAGKIKYRGNPEVTEDIDGLGSVSRE